jgi:hypothetical protein
MNRLRRQGTVRPRLETLEGRWCPSCTASQDGTTLILQATADGL